MIGWISYTVGPRIGTTALVAPGGDLLGWLMLRLGPKLGGHYLSCFGGPDHDRPCVLDPACTPPGKCVADPFFNQLYQWLERPYSNATAAADPLSYPPPSRTDAALLMITGGADPVLHPALVASLAANAGLQPAGPHMLAARGRKLVQWPNLGHDLPDHPGPSKQAHEFLISNGERILPTGEPSTAEQVRWYEIFAPHRDRR